MLRKLIYFFLEFRHPWRRLTFPELAQLYASRMLRSLAMAMVSVFIAVYLYQNGYGITAIMVYFAGYFAVRSVVAIPLGFLVARIGPRHSTLVSNILYIPALVLFAFLPEYQLMALVTAGVLQTISVALYDISYLVDFSKIRNDEHAGKEIGYMQILDQTAKGLSPVIGGFVAFWFGPQATLFLAAVVFLLSSVPLLFSPESVKTKQHITFSGLPKRRVGRNMLAQMAIGADSVASVILWSLLLVISVFGVGSNVVYAELGVLSSVTLVVSIISARTFGMIVDRKRAGELLKVGVVVDSLTHLMRPFVMTPLSALAVNIINDSATTAYALPFTKGVFAQADDLPGYRIAYISLMMMSLGVGATIFCSVVAIFSLFFGDLQTLQLGFVVASLIVLVIMAHGLPALRRSRSWRI